LPHEVSKPGWGSNKEEEKLNQTSKIKISKRETSKERWEWTVVRTRMNRQERYKPCAYTEFEGES